MGQNFAAAVAVGADGAAFLNVDASGNVRTAQAGLGYDTVAASQTKAVLGATGAVGDRLGSLVIVPATTSPGEITLYDGSGSTGIVVFTGGATSVANIAPITIPLNIVAKTTASPGWFVTTGANVSVIATGNFT